MFSVHSVAWTRVKCMCTVNQLKSIFVMIKCFSDAQPIVLSLKLMQSSSVLQVRVNAMVFSVRLVL